MISGGNGGLPAWRWFAAACFTVAFAVRLLGDIEGPVVHQPRFPKSGEPVRILVAETALKGISESVVEYQIVEPGKYISKDDNQYKSGWKRLPLAAASGGQRVAIVPGEVQKHRRLIRYRVIDGETAKRILPPSDDSVPNYAWFAYDGIPAWTGAINPEGQPEEQKPLTIPAEAMRRVQAYHLVTKSESVTQCQWTRPAEFGDEQERGAYRWTGALVADDGTVYDHIRFRARGGQWRHAMGKNMWKFDFNAGHKLAARDDFGRPYKATWGKLNLGACFQQGQYGMRGEQGLFESVGFRLFNMAGVPASRTHHLHFRIVQSAAESGPTQYDGDFFGLYLAVENVDGGFLKEHGLVPQSLFKMEFGDAQLSYDGRDGVGPDNVGSFLGSLPAGNEEAWRSAVNVPEYLGYRAILECIHHYDIGSGKNYFFRRDPATKRWSTVPWDLDLSWSDHMYGNGREPFYNAGILRHPRILQDYKNRLGELLVLLYNEDQAGALVDETAAIVADPRERANLAEADRRHWDWHPMLSSRFTHSSQSAPGSFYQASPTHDFNGMRSVMKRYVRGRGAHLAAKYQLPQNAAPRPTVMDQGSGNIRLISDVAGAKQIEWRLGDITRGSAGARRTPNFYEIDAVWTTNGVAEATIPESVVKSGHKYRARIRTIDAAGVATLWSEPVELGR